MNLPIATYRIQFRNGMTFDRAAGLVPYLQKLGISHLYASPIFTATTGSTHGYDVTDANEIDPVLGGREGFDRLVVALKAAKMGLVLDIVPNHMAASLENRWWRDVIEHGEQSRYAHYFDIDWSRRLTLPFLGDTFEQVLRNGELAIKPDPETGHPALAYYESFYPLTPSSWQGREAQVLATSDNDGIAALHQAQPWQLTNWREAASSLSYRRFFEITGLVGVRVEDEAVFADTHRLILELVRNGAVSGLRVDHVDGLADPKGYLTRLRQQAGGDCWLTVEKILADGESLPADWPVSGTTGYEFIAALSDALVDGTQLAALEQAYQIESDNVTPAVQALRAAKSLMVDHNFAGEFNTLLQLAAQLAAPLNASAEDLRNALRELLIAFPVYRTYGTAEGMPPSDSALLQQLVEAVKQAGVLTVPAALDLLLQLLNRTDSALAATLRSRFQQLSGPLMAKSVEDTLFYRNAMALALNEVGAEPLPREYSLARFHQAMVQRRAQQPEGISTTSTHDTKRAEDARARLYTLSEDPTGWQQHVTRWRALNYPLVQRLADGPAPEAEVEWMLYQALLGCWPETLQPDDAQGLAALTDRFIPFVEKALREAKLRTFWGDSHEAYEQVVTGYARHLLSVDNAAFLQDFAASIQPYQRAGLVNSLTQTVVKLTAPGVPDIYQGSEGLDFSLVDPDNRREPDFARLSAQLSVALPLDFSSTEAWRSGQLKQQLTARLLQLRHQHPALFSAGDYLPLDASGLGKPLAFARSHGDKALIVIAPRLMLRQLSDTFSSACWPQTHITLPAALASRRYQLLFSGEWLQLEQALDLSVFPQAMPLVLLSD